MSGFQYSAQNIRVDDGHILRASLQNGNGDWVDAELDLNTCIGNDNGSFQWGGVDFAGSSDNIQFNIEGDNQPILRATLDGQDRDVNLSERIGNNDGSFYFQ